MCVCMCVRVKRAFMAARTQPTNLNGRFHRRQQFLDSKMNFNYLERNFQLLPRSKVARHDGRSFFSPKIKDFKSSPHLSTASAEAEGQNNHSAPSQPCLINRNALSTSQSGPVAGALALGAKCEAPGFCSNGLCCSENLCILLSLCNLIPLRLQRQAVCLRKHSYHHSPFKNSHWLSLSKSKLLRTELRFNKHVISIYTGTCSQTPGGTKVNKTCSWRAVI